MENNVVGDNVLPDDTSMSIEVFWPMLLVEKPKLVEKTKGGIHIPVSAAKHNTPNRGIVRAVGEIDPLTDELKDSPFEAGDIVQFNRMAASEFEQGETGYCVIHARDVQMRIK